MNEPDDARFDEALEKLLKRATVPTVPDGANSRLMAAIAATGRQQAMVIPLKPRPRWNWPVSLPLAASLMLGFFMGSYGVLDNYLPDGIVGELLAGAADQDLSSGLDEAESYLEGELS